MRIERIPIERIKAAPYNPRKDLQPGDPEYERLKRSIDRWDLVEPLVWNRRTGNLVGGHQRLKILRARGDTEADVSVVDLDPQDEAALNVALNKIGGEWDLPKLADLLSELDAQGFDATLTGFDAEELEELLTWAPDVVPEDEAFGALPDGDKPPFEQMTFTLHRDQADLVREALDAAKAAGPFGDTGNENSNGNALARLAEVALGALR
ncbi:MAG TPA: ParB N-terminal domain-containing protein [Longimicrobiaceae bacterium]